MVSGSGALFKALVLSFERRRSDKSFKPRSRSFFVPTGFWELDCLWHRPCKDCFARPAMACPAAPSRCLADAFTWPQHCVDVVKLLGPEVLRSALFCSESYSTHFSGNCVVRVLWEWSCLDCRTRIKVNLFQRMHGSSVTLQKSHTGHTGVERFLLMFV